MTQTFPFLFCIGRDTGGDVIQESHFSSGTLTGSALDYRAKRLATEAEQAVLFVEVVYDLTG